MNEDHGNHSPSRVLRSSDHKTESLAIVLVFGLSG